MRRLLRRASRGLPRRPPHRLTLARALARQQAEQHDEQKHQPDQAVDEPALGARALGGAQAGTHLGHAVLGGLRFVLQPRKALLERAHSVVGVRGGTGCTRGLRRCIGDHDRRSGRGRHRGRRTAHDRLQRFKLQA